MADDPGPKKPLSVSALQSQLNKFADAVNHDAPLACVLISTSYLEQCLATLIHDFMVDCPTADELCSYVGGVAPSLAKKAKLAYCCGLIPKGMLTSLDLIGAVRNRFAHAHFEIDFTDSVVIDKCKQLRTARPDVYVSNMPGRTIEDTTADVCVDARAQFTTVVVVMATSILAVASGTEHCEPVENKWDLSVG